MVSHSFPPKNVKEICRSLWEKPGFRAFSLAVAAAFFIFLPYVIFDKGYFLYYGDFNVQQIPFYQNLHDAIRSGDFAWSWITDLGANTIGSYSFYNLTSPFFWLTLPFPSKAVPYLMAPLFVLKFGCASLAAYLYLKRYVKTIDFAVMGGLLYAFSGFGIYNIFFNHFMEPMIAFPLLLAAMDCYMYEKKRGVFALAVFFSCWVNYYFFTGQVVFALLYWFLRLATRSWKLSFKDFLWMALEAVLGVAMTGIMLIPTVLAVLQNSRVNNPGVGWGNLLYGNEQRYVHILQCLFFPPDIPARPNFTPDSNAKWASLSAWLPLFGMTGVIAWLQSTKRNWIRKLLVILFFMAAIPLLNSAFQLFNSSYYARWYYMLTLVMILSTLCALERSDVNWSRAFRWSIGITVVMAAAIGLLPSAIENGKYTSYGLEQYPHRFWPYVAIALCSLLCAYLLIPYLRKKPQFHAKNAILLVLLISVVYSLYLVGIGKTQSYDTHNFIIPYALNNGDDLNLPDENEEEFYRVDFYDSMDNMGMFWQMPTIQAFHSIVPGSVMEFYNSIGVERSVGSRPETSHMALRGLTSVKYLFDDVDNDGGFVTNGEPRIAGFRYIDTQNGFDVYVNDAYLPMGFTYTEYCTREQFDALAENQRDLLLLDAILLSDEQIQTYGNLLSQQLLTPSYDSETYLATCERRRQETCDTFVPSGHGFTATIDLSRENLVFFSVPYESGWSATVDGKPVTVEPVNNGFMAVAVDAGAHTIEFTYQTPGLAAGALLSAVSLLIFLGALWLSRRNKKENLPVNG